MQQDHARPKPRNPVQAARGVAIRALLAHVVVRQKAAPMSVVQAALPPMKRATLCNHLARMRDEKRISGYSTAEGWVRVW